MLLKMSNSNLKKFKNIVEYPVTFPYIPKIDGKSSSDINPAYSNCHSFVDNITRKKLNPKDLDQNNLA